MRPLCKISDKGLLESESYVKSRQYTVKVGLRISETGLRSPEVFAF
jgi:hypothetical protein